MKTKIVVGARLVVGLIFIIFGLNGFLQFIPMPPPAPAMGEYMGALMATGFFFPVLKLTEIVGGVLLVANFAVPFAFILLAPIVVQIFLTHLFLDMGGIAMGVLLIVLMDIIAWGYWSHFKGLFSRNISPDP